jgi:hypothetical protein
MRQHIKHSAGHIRNSLLNIRKYDNAMDKNNNIAVMENKALVLKSGDKISVH